MLLSLSTIMAIAYAISLTLLYEMVLFTDFLLQFFPRRLPPPFFLVISVTAPPCLDYRNGGVGRYIVNRYHPRGR